MASGHVLAALRVNVNCMHVSILHSVVHTLWRRLPLLCPWKLLPAYHCNTISILAATSRSKFMFFPSIDPNQNQTNNYGTFYFAFYGTNPSSCVVSVLWHRANFRHSIAHLTLSLTLYIYPIHFLSPKWKRSSLQDKYDKCYIFYHSFYALYVGKNKNFWIPSCQLW